MREKEAITPGSWPPQQRWKRFPVGPLRDHATQLASPFTISRQTKPWVFSNGDFL
jgi:hypothetical protein